MTGPSVATTPAGACDCHVHVFGPLARFPYAEGRAYTPPEAPFEDYRAVMEGLGLQRAVLVQPSVYGTNNRAMLDALGRGGAAFRGVAVIGPEHRDRDLEALHGLGVRGARVNTLFPGASEGIGIEEVARRIAPFGWHLQLLADVSEFPNLARRLGRLPVECVIDHLGHLPAARGADDPGFRDLLALLGEGRCWVKLSAPYRLGAGGPPYADVRPLAEAALRAAPDRLVWGSDWPHPAIPGPTPGAADLLALLADWVPDESLRRKLLVDNPAKLYGFPAL